jgi:hypothetical protein
MEKIDSKTPRDDDEFFLPTLVVHCNEIFFFLNLWKKKHTMEMRWKRW